MESKRSSVQFRVFDVGTKMTGVVCSDVDEFNSIFYVVTKGCTRTVDQKNFDVQNNLQLH